MVVKVSKSSLSSDELNQAPMLRQQGFHHEDEIDLKELFLALWQGKWTVVSSTIVFSIMAVLYALTAEETWTTEAVVTEPQVSDFASYQRMVTAYQPIFDTYREDGAIQVSEKLDEFLESKNIFQIFIQEYRSELNKRNYISSFSTFQKELSNLPEAYSEKDAVKAKAMLYSQWYGKLASAEINSKNNRDGRSFTLKGEQGNAQDSFNFLNGYLTYIKTKANDVAIENVESVIQAKHNELIQQRKLLESRALSKLKNERELSNYALQIAEAANVKTPQADLGDKELFAINIGANALEAKVKVLEGLTELSLLDPTLAVTQAKLNLLSELKIKRDVEFKTFRFIEEPEEPLYRTSPKRKLIVILGVLLGGMIGSAIVLLRFAFRDKNP